PTTSGFNLAQTGIALAKSIGGGAFQGMSEPPIPMYDPVRSAILGHTAPVGDLLGAESIFARASDTDFIDNNGDGQPDAIEPESGITSTPANLDFNGTMSDTPTKAWDRIVGLESPVISDIQTLPALARFVLGGGFLPNYPEFDIVDNDN